MYCVAADDSSPADCRTQRGMEAELSITTSHSRPSSAARSLSRSPRRLSTSGNKSGFVWPRLNRVSV